MNAQQQLSSVEALYRCVLDGGPGSAQARAQLALRSWLSGLAQADARTGSPLPQGWSALCRQAAAVPDPLVAPHDQLGAIIAHAGTALVRLLAQPRQRIERRHAVLPLHAARELDSKSIAWLGRQSGRSLREKLAGKAGILAVQRQNSPNTLENRLLRAFCHRIEPLLALRCEAFPGAASEQELLLALRHWLRESVGTVGHWTHVPPNNVLLQDRYYRKVWDGWLRLQVLDEQVRTDQAAMAGNWVTMLRWKLVARLHLAGLVRFPEQPCHIGADGYRVEPERGAVLTGWPVDTRASGKIDMLGDAEKGGFGFIRSETGRVYFHQRSLPTTDAYQQLRIGMRVRFVPRADGKASAVEIADERHDARRLCVLRPEPDGFALSLGARELAVRLAPMEAGKPGLKIGADTYKLDGYTLAQAGWVVERVLERLGLAGAPGPLPVQADSVAKPAGPAIVDLSELTPSFASGGATGKLPFRLLRQYWKTLRYGEVALDLGEASVLSIRADAPLLSMTDLVQGRDIGAGRRDEAALAFATRLAAFFGDAPLTYLTPDAIDDFALGAARRGLNARFTRAEPLPRSVAALFDWLRGGRRERRVAPGDYVLVLDNVGDAVTVTALQACAAPDLEPDLPQMQGIAWEKFPVLEAGPEAALETLATLALQRQHCNAADEIGAWTASVNAQALALTSWETGPDTFFTPGPQAGATPASFQAVLDTLKQAQELFRRKDCIALILACGGRERMQPLTQALAKAQWPVWPAHSLVAGARTLVDWQHAAGATPLWYESLPDLSIRIPLGGRYARFHLVQGQRIAPRRGVAQEIRVDEVFTLPAGQAMLRLPLRQGAANKPGKVLRYQLQLASPAFPLRDDVPARLKLSFSYGSDDPYALSFVPCDAASAGFGAVRAAWVAADALDLAAHAPAHPPVRSWSELEGQWKSPGMALLDLRLSEIYRTYINVRDNGFPRDAVKRLAQHMRYELRWLMLDIWSDRRTIDDAGCPQDFAHAMRSSLPVLVPLNDEVWRAYAERSDLRDLAAESMFLMCSLRTDMPSEAWPTVAAQLAHCLEDRAMLDRARFSIACLLGRPDRAAALLPQLMAALKQGDASTQAIIVDLLGLALWRAPELLEAVSTSHLQLLIAALGRRLRSAAHKITLSGGVSRGLGAELRDCLEVLLALLRTRRSEQVAVARLLALGSPAVSEFAGILESIEPQVCRPDTVLKPRIAFEANKPASLQATPDLLYLTNLYLLGESGVGQIRITGTLDEE